MVALAQTPPASAAPKTAEPVFAEFRPGTQTQAVSASNVSPAVVKVQRAGDRGEGAEGAGQSALSGTGANTATASTSASVTPGPPASLSGYVADDKYKLRVGDKISLQILEDRDAPKSLVVADSGELDVPYVGRVAASDKTCKQLADELKTRLEKEYYHRATVVIALDVANKLLGRVYVWGQVRNQGPIDISVNENLTAGKAILRAGGFGDFANKKKVKVVRSGATDGAAKQSFELNMIDILEKGKTEKDMVLQPDDFIIIPSRLINF